MVDFIIMIGIHLISDFYLQTSRVAKCKNANVSDTCGNCKKCKGNTKVNMRYLLTHIVIYMLPFVFLLGFVEWHKALIIIALLGASHGFIDLVTCLLKNKWKPICIFVFDQILHIFSIYVIIESMYLQLGLDMYIKQAKIICMGLILIRPCSILIDKLLKSIYPETKDMLGRKEIDVGSVIGIMERILTVIFAYLGDFAAIAIIVTAKTWARSDDLKGEENKDFRNKYLLGTMTSLVLALIAVTVYKVI